MADTLTEIKAWHGTGDCGFAAFDVTQAGPYNLGLHFGTKEAAQGAEMARQNASPEIRRRLDAPFTRLNHELIGLFQSLGYDGLVYQNELESGPTAADSYVVFEGGQVDVIGEVPCAFASRAA